MKEDYINVKTAKSAKEKGFNIPTSTYYVELWTERIIEKTNNCGSNSIVPEKWYAKVTQTLLQKWLREKHQMEFYIVFPDGFWKYMVHTNFGKPIKNGGTGFKTYEEAFEAALQEALNLIL